MVVAVHGGDGHPCVAVVVLLYDFIRAWWSIMNEGCTLSKHCAVMLGYRGYTSS